MTSDSGYSISRFHSPNMAKYTAWGPGVYPARAMLLCTDDLVEAKRACEQHQQVVQC